MNTDDLKKLPAHEWEIRSVTARECVRCGRVEEKLLVGEPRYRGGQGYAAKLTAFPGACVLTPATAGGKT